VPAVAKKAGYSLHHFIRLFSGVIGSPPKEYIARRKLSEAARELAAGGRRVTDVAFDYGFKDLETFTRAFRRELGTTPTAVRRGAMFPFVEAVVRPRAAPSDGTGIREAPVIESMDAFTIVGRSIRVQSETDEVGKLWKKSARMVAGGRGGLDRDHGRHQDDGPVGCADRSGRQGRAGVHVPCFHAPRLDDAHRRVLS
jgi:AraC-like DNA-binding protein